MRSIALALALALALPAAAASAQPRPPRPPRGPGGFGPPPPGPEMIEELAADLGLSAKQKQQIRDLQDEARKQHVKLRADMELLEIDLRRELDADEPDADRVGQMIDKLGALETSARKLEVVTWLKIRKVLTKDQRARLEELHARRRREWHERHRSHEGGAPEAPDGPDAPARPRKPPRPR